MKKKLLLLTTSLSVLTTSALVVSCQTSLDKKKEELINLGVKIAIKQNQSNYDKKSETEKKEYEKQQKDKVKAGLDSLLTEGKSIEWEKILDDEIVKARKHLVDLILSSN
ncbi:hypothetical protein [Mycoplasma sp. 1012]